MRERRLTRRRIRGVVRLGAGLNAWLCQPRCEAEVFRADAYCAALGPRRGLEQRLHDLNLEYAIRDAWNISVYFRAVVPFPKIRSLGSPSAKGPLEKTWSEFPGDTNAIAFGMNGFL